MASVAERLDRDVPIDGYRPRARGRGFPVGVILRGAVAAFEGGLKPDERARIDGLLGELTSDAERLRLQVDETVARVQRPIDEVAIRARVNERLAEEPFDLDRVLRDVTAAARS